MKTILTYSDPSHAWAKVKVKELEKLNILKDISSFSYVSKCREYLFLEEDRDLSLYVKALEENKIPFKFKENVSNKQSRIRNYPRFKHTVKALIPFNSYLDFNAYLEEREVIPLGVFYKGLEFYAQEELPYYVDLGFNNPNIGFILNGVFWKFTDYQDYNYKRDKVINMLDKGLTDGYRKMMEDRSSLLKETLEIRRGR